MKTYKQNGWDVPEGYVIVPVEPNREMMDSAASRARISERGILHNPCETIQAALINAPQPPAKPEVGAGPVAWLYEDSCGTHFTDDEREWRDTFGIYRATPLYATPVAAPVSAEPVAWRSKQSPYLISVGGSRIPSDGWEALYAAPTDAQAIRDAALEGLRGRVMEMQDSLETYGQYSEEAVRIALDGVLDEIDEVIQKGGAA